MNQKLHVCFFNKSKICRAEPDVVVEEERLQVISDFKYLGVHINNSLTFKLHINLANFRYAHSCMSTKAAKKFLHSMIFSHITYCLTTWSQATLLSNQYSLYINKVLHRKFIHYHHCSKRRLHSLVKKKCIQSNGFFF